MTNLCKLNPFFRHSAREVLKNPIFDDIRIPFNEKQSEEKLKLEVD